MRRNMRVPRVNAARLPERDVLVVRATHRTIKLRISALYDELMAHDGYGSLKVEMRLLRRGQKEIIIDCGKQFRYVVDFEPSASPPATSGAGETRPAPAGAIVSEVMGEASALSRTE